MLGSGTVNDPYQVATSTDLYDVRNDMTAHYKQVADIDMSGYVGWTPITALDGDGYDIFFSGSFNGNGFNISGFYGLIFKVVSGSLSNIQLVNFNNTAAEYAGIALVTGGIIQNCSITGENNYSNSYVTIVAQVGAGEYLPGAVVENCVVNVECKTVSALTGICWRNYESVRKCALKGSVFGDEAILATCLENNYGTIDDCYVIGSVLANTGYICIAAYGHISNSYVIGNFSIDGLGETVDKNIGVCVFVNSYAINSYYNAVEGASVKYGTQKTEAELKQQSTFSGWDFDTIWSINPNANDGYPYLQWENLVIPVNEVLPSYVPQSSIELVFNSGDSADYAMGRYYIDKTQYKVNTASLKADGRNSIGKYFKDQTFDEACKFSSQLVSDMLESILAATGLTDYYVQPSTTYMGMDFAPNKSILDGIEEIIQYLPGWQIREEVSGQIVIAEKTDSHFTQPSRYTFQRDRDIFSRDVVTDDRSVYGRVCVHTSDFSVKVWRPVTSNLGWNAPPKKTMYQQVPAGTTSFEAATLADALADNMSNSGAVETFLCPLMPQIMPGDEAEVLEADSSKTMIGVITQVKHSFGDKGFTTEIVVDSGGRIGKRKLTEIIKSFTPASSTKTS